MRTWATICLAALICAGAYARPTSAAPRPTQVLTVVNHAGITGYKLRRAEAAVVRQVDRAARWWPVPHIVFGEEGWPVTLDRVYPAGSEEPLGTHSFDVTPTIAIDVQRGTWTVTFSHEILEALVDPTIADGAPEVCDPVEGSLFRYKVGGVFVSDYVLPAYYEHPQPSSAPLDYRHKLRAFLRWWNR